jgi:hypothetical protein
MRKGRSVPSPDGEKLAFVDSTTNRNVFVLAAMIEWAVYDPGTTRANTAADHHTIFRLQIISRTRRFQSRNPL